MTRVSLAGLDSTSAAPAAKRLPLLDIAKAMIPVGEIPAVHTEVIRHHN